MECDAMRLEGREESERWRMENVHKYTCTISDALQMTAHLGLCIPISHCLLFFSSHVFLPNRLQPIHTQPLKTPTAMDASGLSRRLKQSCQSGDSRCTYEPGWLLSRPAVYQTIMKQLADEMSKCTAVNERRS